MWTAFIGAAKLMAVTLFSIGSIFLQYRELKETHIIIIGAGSSGIAAASRLLENGVDDIVILEAENRIGGRTNTVKLGDGVVDLGCQWVHGEEGNIVFKMAKEHDLLIDSVVGKDKEITFIDESGNLIDTSTTTKYMSVFYEIIEAGDEDLVNYTGSLGQYFENEYPKRLKSSALSDTHLDNHFLAWFEKAENLLDGSDSWHYTSGRGETISQECKGNQNWAWKANGYATVLDLLMKKIPDPTKELPVMSKVNLDTEVTKIIWDNSPEHSSKKIQVECSNGLTYLADHVIVTVSLGVLKEKVHSMFSPALPAKNLNAIKGLSMGTVDKIYLKFPYKWWPDKHASFGLLHPEDHPPCRRKACWTKDVFMFSSVDNQPLVLCGWLVGPAARIMEQLPIEEVREESVKLLEKFIGRVFNVPVPQPDQIIRTTWYSNPHFRGSYSHRSMDTEAMGTSADDLAEPVLNNEGLPVVMFAGEATHSHYYSTAHGAIETGLREADRILNFKKSSD